LGLSSTLLFVYNVPQIQNRRLQWLLSKLHLSHALPHSRLSNVISSYQLQWSPFFENKLAVATSANYGLVGNGRLYVLGVGVGPNGVAVERVYVYLSVFVFIQPGENYLYPVLTLLFYPTVSIPRTVYLISHGAKQTRISL
jgi:hypothetical protein